jgi:2-keto-4-pentenoate hydratase/2-oxohepta-3-ene-1,7-dioic acid hydratase in catechol pathway
MEELELKLVRYGDSGAEKPGLLGADGQVRDLSGVVDDIGPATLAPESLQRLAAIAPETLPIVPAGMRLGPCVGGTRKMVCVGLNYRDHAAEAGKAVPSEPMIFMKAISAIVGPNDDVLVPRGAERMDLEVELGVVIGTKAKYVAEADAYAHVAGYCLVNDLSERNFQSRREGQFTKGKSCDTFGPVGPWLATPDEIGDVHQLRMFSEVDGVTFQNGTTADMVFKVPFLISYLSQFFTLEPGDIIATGTPAGVGMGKKPPEFLRAGQTIRIGIDRLGVQRQALIADQ